MLSIIELRHFKCFERLCLPVAPLTLLSGTNAAGKSSVLQALVLLHQTIFEHEWSTRLMLNGRTLRLGTVQDVIDELYGRKRFEVGLVDDDRSIRWAVYGEREEMSLAVQSVEIEGEALAEPSTLRHLIPPAHDGFARDLVERLRDLTYITAERIGPREVYPLEDRQVARVVGPRGEHTASVLFRGRDDSIRPALRLPGASPKLLAQVERHMQRFFPDCRIAVNSVPGANAVTLGLATAKDTSLHRPMHVGFGLTQVLPIVVAALSAAEGGLLLIENPEVHLHPAGQAKIGGFLAEVAASGVQVVLETHSDHVLNGIRRAVKAKVLAKPEHAALHFFRERSRYSDQVVSPSMDRDGNLDCWPEGFFDQFDKDMNHFAGWGD